METAGFHAIAADLHVAPTPRVVLAGVQKQPFAGLAAAWMDTVHIGRHQ
jgi:hypothetical protein